MGGVTPALAHHGFGLFQMEKLADWSGTLTKFDLVNPHSYLYFDTVGADGKPLSMRCEMRAATLIKRSGWKTDEFVVGRHVDIHGHPHRDDPHSCYLESVSLGGSHFDRSQRSVHASAGRHFETAVEACVRRTEYLGRLGRGAGRADHSTQRRPRRSRAAQPARSVRGRRDHHRRDQGAESGAVAAAVHRGRSNRRRGVPHVVARGQSAPAVQADEHHLRLDVRLACESNHADDSGPREGHRHRLWPLQQHAPHPLRAWTNIPLGLRRATRGIRSASGRATRWSSTPSASLRACCVPPTRNSDKLHVVERFTLDPKTFALKREYTVEDPVYLATPYTGQDTVLLSDTPFEKQRCAELTFEFTQPGN